MRRLLLQAALVLMIASAAVAHADTFTLTWNYDNIPSAKQTVTFYLPPVLADPKGGEGELTVGNAIDDGYEFQGVFGFYSPEATDGTDKLLSL
jgi:hypothetical protein